MAGTLEIVRPEAAKSTDYPTSVRAAVSLEMSSGHPGIGRTARTLGSSVRTMQRKLSEAGTTYSDLVDEVRREAALQRMVDPRTRMCEIAAALGFADAGSFSRAFKRWTGRTPVEQQAELLRSRGERSAIQPAT